LDEQLGFFDGEVYPALAAYNAGPGNALRWWDGAEGNPDLYIERVNFPETRTYLEKIFVGYTIYQYLYNPE
jgi:soluble lytic murein transglycosylase